MKLSSDFAASVIVACAVIFAYVWLSARARAKAASRDLARRADEGRRVRQMVADVQETCVVQAAQARRARS